MKVTKKHQFTPTGEFTGTILPCIDRINTTLTGSKKQPAESIMLAYGGNAWSQERQSLSFMNDTLTIENLQQTDWTEELKRKWTTAICKRWKINNPLYLPEIQAYFDSNHVFELLSGCCVSYVTQDETSGEISVGISAHPFPYLKQLSKVGSKNLRTELLQRLPNEDILVSHVFKLTYLAQSEIVWAFDADSHPYTINERYDLFTGSGKYYTDIKLAGNGVKASYIIKKDIDPLDPTQGLFSGTSENLNVGDQIHLIDTTVYTTLSEEGQWTWIGDYSTIPYRWHICDITTPIEDTRALAVDTLVFPIDILNDAEFDDNYNLK